MIVKSTGAVTFRAKKGAVPKREGPVYLHLLEVCTQNYFEGFAYNKVVIGADTMKLLKKEQQSLLVECIIDQFKYIDFYYLWYIFCRIVSNLP